MKVTKLSDYEAVGAPLYDMRVILNHVGECNVVKFSVITMPPHVRVPLEGTGAHEEDEYSFFVKGGLYTESGEDKCNVSEGMVTLIPKGEPHWCENRSDEPCTLVCVMVK